MTTEGVRVRYPVHRVMEHDENSAIFPANRGDLYRHKLLPSWCTCVSKVDICEDKKDKAHVASTRSPTSVAGLHFHNFRTSTDPLGVPADVIIHETDVPDTVKDKRDGLTR